MNAGASTYAVPSPIKGSGTAWVLLGSWALSPARPTPIHPRHECRGLSALFGDGRTQPRDVPGIDIRIALGRDPNGLPHTDVGDLALRHFSAQAQRVHADNGGQRCPGSEVF